MLKANEYIHCRLAWLLLLLGLVARLVMAQSFLLAPEEANVWRWSRELAAGYPEHPPLLIWAIHMSTAVLGHSELAVRLPTILGLAVAGTYLNLLTALWGSWRSAWHMQLLLQGLLLCNGLALIATPDGLLLPCWAGALYHIARAQEQRWANHLSWVAGGFWLGLGLLSKFTMVLFVPALFVALLWNDALGRSLRQSAAWLGMLLALLLVLPLVLWNIQHDWMTARHFQDNLHLTLAFSWRPVLDFLASQAALLSPLLLPLIWLAWGTALGNIGSRERRLSYLAWMSLLPFCAILLLSFGSRGHSTWSAPAYLSALVLTTLLFAPKAGTRISWIWLASVVSAWGTTILVMVQVFTSLLPVPVLLDRTARETSGWRDLAQAVEKELAAMPQPDQTFVFSAERYLADQLAFYLPGHPETAFFHPWRVPPDEGHRARGRGINGGDAVGVLTEDHPSARLQGMFASVSTPQPYTIHRVSSLGENKHIMTVYLVRATGFRGDQAR